MIKALLKFKQVFLVFVYATIIFSYLHEINSRPENYVGKRIKKIDFKGNVNVTEGDLYDLIQMRTGMQLNLDLLNKDLKSIYEEGSFASAHVEAENTAIKSYLDTIGKQVNVFEAKGAFVYLYDLNPDS
ncbi:MAG: hypothetical protein HC820_08345 [Hydrococcus sp. RM1_1_31]|nr:hypothetical protein [Hydrococcus sp. RM1_1_31]